MKRTGIEPATLRLQPRFHWNQDLTGVESSTVEPPLQTDVSCCVLTKCYYLYFGSYDHIGVRWYSQCLYDVIMCGGPLGGALSIGVLCSVYKARCSRSSGLWKKQVSLRHKRTKATQQDLDNHILLCKTNGIDYVPRS